MKRRDIWLLTACAAVLVTITVCFTRDTVMTRYGKEVEGQTYRTITEREALELSEEAEIFWVDVREENELASGMISGALHWPLSDFDGAVQAEKLEKDAILLLYCSSGVRSDKAARKLAKLGYRYVFDFGSIQNWHGGLE